MKIKYLGTAAYEGVPSLFCDCEVCRKSAAAGGKNVRTQTQALIDGTMMLGAFYVTLPPGQSSAFIAGVACASASWFTGLSLAVSLFSDKISPKLLRAINAVCGVVIIFYGLKLLYGLTRFF